MNLSRGLLNYKIAARASAIVRSFNTNLPKNKKRSFQKKAGVTNQIKEIKNDLWGKSVIFLDS